MKLKLEAKDANASLLDEANLVLESKEKVLDLTGSILSAMQVNKLFDALGNNPNITQLILANCQFFDVKARETFVERMSKAKTLSSFDVRGTRELLTEWEVGNMKFPLMDILKQNSHIHVLLVRASDSPSLTQASFLNVLFFWLEKSKTLRELTLEDCTLRAPLVKAFASMLRNNKHLIQLFIKKMTIKTTSLECDSCEVDLITGIQNAIGPLKFPPIESLSFEGPGAQFYNGDNVKRVNDAIKKKFSLKGADTEQKADKPDSPLSPFVVPHSPEGTSNFLWFIHDRTMK